MDEAITCHYTLLRASLELTYKAFGTADSQIYRFA